MSNKIPSVYPPKIAVFDLVNPPFKAGNGNTGGAVYSSKAGRRHIMRRSGSAGNSAAVNFASTGKTNRIAVLVESLSHAHNNEIISGIEAVAGKTGYEIAILNLPVKPAFLTNLGSFDGCIVCCSDESIADLDFLREIAKPAAIVGNTCYINGFHNIKIDYPKGAQLAVNHLLEKGCEDIAMIAAVNGNGAVSLDQYLGYRDALKMSRKQWREPLTVTEASMEAGMEVAATMFTHGKLPDGVFINNDWVAAGFLKFLKTAGTKLSENIAVIGSGNELLCQMVAPAMCSIDFQKGLAGSTAMNILLDHIIRKQPLISDSVTIIEPAIATGV